MATDHADYVLQGWARLRPEVDVAAYALTTRLIRAGQLLHEHVESLTAAQGLPSRGHYDVLSSLRRAHPQPLSPSDIASRVLVATPTVTGRLKRLESMDLVARGPDPADGRGVRVSITNPGIEVADALFAAIADRLTSLLADLPEEISVRIQSDLGAVLRRLGDLPPARPTKITHK